MAEGDDVLQTYSSDKLTYDDFLLFPDDGLRHELIDGVHYVSPSPNMKHQQVSGNLYWLLRSYLERHPRGRVFYAPFDVVFSRFDVVEPDLLYLSHAQAAEVLTEKHVAGSPDLVIEIESPSTRGRDETIKRRLYDSSRVREYWLIDPIAEVVYVYRRVGGAFEQPIQLSRENGDVLTSDLFPGLTVTLDEVFRL